MGAYDRLEQDRVDEAKYRLDASQMMREQGLLLDAVAESIASLHQKADALAGQQIPAPVIDNPIDIEIPVVDPVEQLPRLLEPLNRFFIHDSEHTLKWNDGGFDDINIEVGTSLGGHDIFFQSDAFEDQYLILTDLPVQRVDKIYVRLWYRQNAEDAWSEEKTIDYEYKVDVVRDVSIPDSPMGRARLVFPPKPDMQQQDALPIKINADGTAELSRAKQVELSHEPSRQGAPVVQALGALASAIKSRVPLILIKGTAMKGMSLSLTSEKFNGVTDGVTVIQPEHDGAVCPNIYLQDTSAVVARGFHWQNRTWKFRSNGVCNSTGVSGIRFTQKTTKTPIAFNAPDRNRGVMENCFAQDVFSVYDETVGYDEVQVAFGTADIGWENGKVAHARNCRVYNTDGINHGDRIQNIANFNVNGSPVLARTNMEDCVFAGGLGLATFARGVEGGNDSPENGGLDDKCQSDNPVKPLLSIGGTSIGFGPSSSDRGIMTIHHGAGGYAISSNHLAVAMPTAAASSAYHDMDGVEISHTHVCGGGNYKPWRELGFTDYKHRAEEFAFINYVDIKGKKPAKMHSNTAYDHGGIGYGGGRMLRDNEVRELILKFPAEFIEADRRLANGLKIYVPTNTRELLW